MFNPLESAVTNYINFWEKTSTYERVGAHGLTLIPVIILRANIRANPANIAYIHELMAVLGLISHIIIALSVGRDATKKLDPVRVDLYAEIKFRFDQTDQYIHFLQEDLTKLRDEIADLKKKTA